MKKFFKKIWRASPADIWRILRGALKRQRNGDFAITEIKSGQASGIFMNLPRRPRSYYTQMVSGNYEPYILDSIRKKTDLDGKTVWDIGAHIGYHTLLFAKYVGRNGRVAAFEPSPDNEKSLRNNISLNKSLASRIFVRKMALSDQAGTAKMLIAPNAESASSSGGRLENIAGPYENSIYENFKKAEISLETMDGAARKLGFGPDIVKIDVEGAEAEVLRGGAKIIAEKRPIIAAEIHTVLAMYEVLEILRNWNYEVSILDFDSVALTKNILAAPK